MTKIIGYIHICQKGEWKRSLDMIFNFVKNYGLYDSTTEIRLGVVADNGNISEDYRLHNNKFKTIFTGDSLLYERPTLLHMRNSCESDGSDTVYWYLHTKGLRHFGTEKESFVVDWIKLMLYWNIQRWNYAVEMLNSHNTYGINIFANVFYSGNFWWAKSTHIAELPTHIEDYYTAPEDWILRKKDGIFQAFSSGIQGEGHYNQNYPQSLYMPENDLNKILPDDFYIDTYKLYNFNSNKNTNQEYIEHYLQNNTNSNIRYNREAIIEVFLNKLPKLFDLEFYKSSDTSIINYSLEELIVHWFTIGKYEEREISKNMKIPKNFDYNFYREYYKDLKDLNDEELLLHWNLHGKNEKRKFNLESDFNYIFYRNYYKDLNNFTDDELLNHWRNNGKKEGRNYIFDFNFYRNKYNDLKLFSDMELIHHWINHGQKEGRLCKMTNTDISDDFDCISYRNKYSDLKSLSNSELITHWINYGEKEGRTCKL